MPAITDRAMQSKVKDEDQWLSQPFKRGAGVFMGRITPTGERLFYFRYTDSQGRRPFLPLGAYHPKGINGMSLADAYARATELSKLYQSGTKDLREHLEAERLAAEHALEVVRQRAVAEATAAKEAALAAARRLSVQQLFDHWQRVELKPQTLADGTRTGRKDGGEWVKAAFERRVFPIIGTVAAEEVKRADLLAILDECKAEGLRRTANVLLADLRQMFRFAAEREIVQRNPLEGIKRASIGGKDVERDRVLADEELRVLWAAVPQAAMSPRSAAAIWLTLATACRVGEAMSARWEHFKLESDAEGRLVSGTWYLPTTKNERDHTIHLSAFALKQVQALLSLREFGPAGDGGQQVLVPWVFPNSARTGPVDIKSFGKQLADRQRKAGKRLANRSKATAALALSGGKWTAHDLRRTAATIMARLGVSTDVIDECLNHKLQSKVARVYIKDRRLSDQARAFDALGEHLQALVVSAPIGSNQAPQQHRARARLPA